MSNARHTFNNVLTAHENDLLVENSPHAKNPEVKKSNLKSKYERKFS